MSNGHGFGLCFKKQFAKFKVLVCEARLAIYS